ncbi:MAG: hypothetical protein IKU29_02410, partial [Parabacteroides sp.]|nr:hypothetical protein [Parabacteroides sp.]
MNKNIDLSIQIDDGLMNNIIQKGIAQSFRNSRVEDRLYCYGTTKLNNYINRITTDGTLVTLIAKNVAKELPMSAIEQLIDKEKLIEIIAERMVKRLLATSR